MSATTIDLQRVAKDHLWMHFTRMGGYADQDVPIIVRGDGCYLEDANGKRYLDAHDDRHVGVGIAPHPREVHPEVILGDALEIDRGGAHSGLRSLRV